jgi:hypothetical protein
MLPVFLWALGLLQASFCQTDQDEQRPVILTEDRSLLCLVRILTGGWVDTVDCSVNPHFRAQQLCNQSNNLDPRKIVWLYETSQDESNPNLWRERLAGQGFQVRSINTIRKRNGELDYLKTLPLICKQLSECYPDLSWYFRARQSLVEQGLNSQNGNHRELLAPSRNIYAN